MHQCPECAGPCAIQVQRPRSRSRRTCGHGNQSCGARRSSDGRVTVKPTQQQAAHRNVDKRLARLHIALVVSGQPPNARQQGEAASNHPPARVHSEALRAGLAHDEIQVPSVALLLAPPWRFLASLRRVRPDLRKARHGEHESTRELARTDRDMDKGAPIRRRRGRWDMEQSHHAAEDVTSSTELLQSRSD